MARAPGTCVPVLTSLQRLNAQEQRLDLIVSEQDLLITAFLRGEHDRATCDLRGFITPHLDAVGEEVSFDVRDFHC